MKLSRVPALLAAGSLALATAACGGGDSPAPMPTPSPTPSAAPTPTPAPTPAPSADTFGTLGQTQSQTFTTLGYTYTARSGPFDDIPVHGSEEPFAAVGMRLVAPSSLVLSIGGIGEGTLSWTGGSGVTQGGRFIEKSYSAMALSGWLYSVLWSENAYLDHVMGGNWLQIDPAASNPLRHFAFMYGVATPPPGVPASGTAEFKVAPGWLREISNLAVDYAAGTVGGTLKLATEPIAREYTLTDVRFSPDRTGFSGRLTWANSAQDGTLAGYFAGPHGEEIVARYVVPSGADMPDFVLGVGLVAGRRQ